MKVPPSDGIRLLSFDGGDIRTVSQLIILNEFMQRVEWDRKTEDRILPCDYFHLMAGTGTGGLIAILLGVICMSVEEAIQTFTTIWETVYADETLDKTLRLEKLADAMRNILKLKGIPDNRLLYPENPDLAGCNVFVCVAPDSNLGLCEKLRNYKARATSVNPTVIEALQATCADPTFFLPVSIGSTGARISYVTGAYNFNNPVWECIKEACEHFGSDRMQSFS